jgi:LysM repeat protein
MRFTAILACLLVFGTIFASTSRPAQVLAQADDNQQTTQQKSEEPKETGKRKVKVKEGDTLIKIAKKNKTNYKRLYYANTKIKHPDLIYPGQKLRIPSVEEKLKKRPLPDSAEIEQEQTTAPSTVYAQSNPVVYSNDGSVWDRLAQCESGGNWSINTGNGYYGGLQFTLGSWWGVGGSGYPHQASKSEQIARGKILQSRQGWGAWPACAAMLGLL